MQEKTIPTAVFNKIKPALDGLVFHREENENTIIKFIGCYLKWIDKRLMEIIDNNTVK